MNFSVYNSLSLAKHSDRTFVTAGVVFTVFTFIFGFHRVPCAVYRGCYDCVVSVFLSLSFSYYNFSKAIIKILYNSRVVLHVISFMVNYGYNFHSWLVSRELLVYDIFCLCWIELSVCVCVFFHYIQGKHDLKKKL